MMFQTLAAFSIVGLVFLWMAWGFFRRNLALPLAQYFLHKGKVKWAMRLRSWSAKPPCCQ